MSLQSNIALLEIFNGQNFQAFVDFDISSKIKTPKIGFNLIFIGQRAYILNIYSWKVGKRESLKYFVLKNFHPYDNTVVMQKSQPCDRNSLWSPFRLYRIPKHYVYKICIFVDKQNPWNPQNLKNWTLQKLAPIW